MKYFVLTRIFCEDSKGKDIAAMRECEALFVMSCVCILILIFLITNFIMKYDHRVKYNVNEKRVDKKIDSLLPKQILIKYYLF